MYLNFKCSGKNYKHVSSDHITKFITEDDVLCDKKYNLLTEKEIDVNDIENISVHIYVSTNPYDQNWLRDKKITISNIKVLIYGK